MAPRPRVVVVGAGMAGLSAAHRLHQTAAPFELTVLEGSDRLGGRILTSFLGSDQVELGATFIHGINGSPVFGIAQRIGAMSGDGARELGSSGGPPAVRAQGGLVVDPQLVGPAMDLYRTSMALVKNKGEGRLSPAASKGSVGAFLRQRLFSFLSEQAAVQKPSTDGPHVQNSEAATETQGKQTSILREEEDMKRSFEGSDINTSGIWNPLALQESAFMSLQAMERCLSACDSLDDLDLDALKEYTEYPGPHKTIAKGYISVLKELEGGLPSGTVKLRKKVQKIYWNRTHPSTLAPVVLHCEDGSVVEAEHVILTMSLGVLKTGTLKNFAVDSSVCRSVQDLQGWKAYKEFQDQELFEPTLPTWKLEAISRLGFGVVDKLFLLLDPSADKHLRQYFRFLHHKDSVKVESLPKWTKKIFSMTPVYPGSNVLSCWLAGEEALEMEGLSDDEVLNGVAQMLTSFGVAGKNEGTRRNRDDFQELPEDEKSMNLCLRSMFRGVLRSKWATNPLCQGSYSFVAVGSSGRDLETLAEPLPEGGNTNDSLQKSALSLCSEVREGDGLSVEPPTSTDPASNTKSSPLQLLFAGEATNRNFYSTTHGAFLSGVREADRLLKHYKV